MSKINIFLDDVRNAPEGYIRTWTVEETVMMIFQNQGGIDILSLDNDLGLDQLEGYKVLDWMESIVHSDPNFILPDQIRVHSANPVARKRMEVIIQKLWK